MLLASALIALIARRLYMGHIRVFAIRQMLIAMYFSQSMGKHYFRF